MVFNAHQSRQPINPMRLEQPYRQLPTQQRFPGVSQSFLPTKSSLSQLATKGVGGLSKTLTNVQQVLKVIESTAPIVEQYGPMVKNIPAMYRIVKSLKEFEDTEDLPSDDSSPKSTEVEENAESISSIKNKKKTNEIHGQSMPKLFI